MVMSVDKVAFNWPGDISDDNKTGNWALDKMPMVLFYPLVNKDVFSANVGLVDRVVKCWQESDAAAKPSKAAKQQKKVKAIKDTEEHIRLNPEQIEKIVPHKWTVLCSSQICMARASKDKSTSLHCMHKCLKVQGTEA